MEAVACAHRDVLRDRLRPWLATILVSDFKCEQCGEVFEKAWSDAEAHLEQMANGFGDLMPEDRATVCDDCYEAIMARLRSGKRGKAE